jgi:predicted membrane channel-forming protein YqfA (hemolysin III family)
MASCRTTSPITPTVSHTDIERNATMIGSTYPLLDLFWTMLEIFFFILWIWLLIFIFSDIFRSHDMGGGAKALWVIFLIIFPLLGILVYPHCPGREHARTGRGPVPAPAAGL